MITLEHAVIRTADPDDAWAIRELHDREPRAAYLNRKREILLPTTDDLREMLRKKDTAVGLLAVEDRAGKILGLCALRGGQQETAHGEFLFLFGGDGYTRPEAAEALRYLCRHAFREKRMHKVMAQCLENEKDFRDLLIRHGFQSNGVQREVLYSQGRWYNIESLTLFAADYSDGATD